MAEMPIETEVLPINTRRQNREAIIRLFHGFVADFGNETAEKIIRHLVHATGGLRIQIPKNNGDPLYGCSNTFRRLWVDICKGFQRESGHLIMIRIVEELGGRRISFPDHDDICRIKRNEKIRDLCNEVNRKGLALRFNLSEAQIDRITRDVR
jgi:hypothetical protein